MARFVSEELGPDHGREAFDCGSDTLNHWLLAHAPHAQAMLTARTFVWHEHDMKVVAYFSLAAHLIVRGQVPNRLSRGSPRTIPAILLARLALDISLHGEGLGGELLWDALSRACAASRIAAARLVVVDALNDHARAFYEHHGFVALADVPYRLMQKVSDITAALA